MPWDTTLPGCCSDCRVLCFSVLCCPCQVAIQRSRALGKSGCYCCDCFCSPLPCFTAKVWSEIREKYNIEGGYCGDLLIVCCCTVCAVSQQSRQLQIRGDKPAGMCMES